MLDLRRRLGITLFLSALLLLLPLSGGVASAQGSRMLRQPTVSASHIAFVHANDIWLASRAGGRAHRLTSADGAETGPSFSPNGEWVAFFPMTSSRKSLFMVGRSRPLFKPASATPWAARGEWMTA